MTVDLSVLSIQCIFNNDCDDQVIGRSSFSPTDITQWVKFIPKSRIFNSKRKKRSKKEKKERRGEKERRKEEKRKRNNYLLCHIKLAVPAKKIPILVKTNGLWSYKTIFKQSKQKNMSTNFYPHMQNFFPTSEISSLLSKLKIRRTEKKFSPCWKKFVDKFFCLDCLNVVL